MSTADSTLQASLEELRCPACGSASHNFTDSFVFKSARGLKPWKRCPNCRAYFLTESYDSVREVTHTTKAAWGRDDTGLELNDFKQRMFHSVIGLLNAHCPPPATLLDVGCSYGGFLIEARKAGYNVCGFDIVPRAVEYVRSQALSAEIAFSIGRVKSVEDESLDVITCLDCNYYWSHQTAELAHAYMKLKGGGYLAMRVVDKSWMFSLGLLFCRVSKIFGERTLRAAVNDHRFSMPLQSLLKVLRGTGFEVRYVSPRGAIHSDRTRFPVKLSFGVGGGLWATGAGMFAPGALILARKPAQ